MRGHSYRSMLRASSVMGSASVITMIALLIKMKLVALIAGAAGVGLVGLYQSFMQTAAAVANLGLVQSGTRSIAAASGNGDGEPSDPDTAQLWLLSRTLYCSAALQAIVAAAIIWLMSDWVALHVLGDSARIHDAQWLALGVAAMVLTSAPMALLQGMRRIRSIAIIQVVSGLAGTLIAAAALMLWGTQALLIVAISAPLVTWVAWQCAAARHRLPAGCHAAPATEMLRAWRGLARLGIAFMISGLVCMGGYLAARILVQRELGIDALGHFQASWAIGTTYLALVLNAMSSDFYPRLSASIHDKVASVRLINEQTEVGLLLCAPLVLAIIGLSPWVIALLYTDAFHPASAMLRWQLLGDILKIMSWPLGMVMLALGAGKLFVLSESIGIASLLIAMWLLLPIMSVEGAGLAYLLHYTIYLPFVWWIASRRLDFRFSSAVKQQAAFMAVAAICVAFAGNASEVAGAAAGVILAAGFAAWALRRLLYLSRN